ncbi:glycosyltransferase family 39 protein [Stappia sp.]|uniref:ArnT family glycosyltransferase n=1 Tax=Stappia sp. TaxID=1870903 RepID=UPI0032D9443E
MSELSAQQDRTAFETTRERWLRYLGHRGLAPAALLVLAVLFFLPGLTQVPPLDRDEPRFAQASKQMVETRDFVDIRFQETARHKKPVGIYWLQSAAVEASGLGADAPIWVYRLPSQLGALLAVLLTYWCARAFTGPRAALVAGALVSAALILGVEARLAKTDAMLLASILAAQGALARIWLDRGSQRTHKALAVVFWGALAASVLIKGPVGPMVVGLTIALLSVAERSLSWVRGLYPLVGIVGFLVLVLPWFVAIHLHTDGAFFAESIGQDLLGKVATGQESHGAPPLTHLAASLGTFWPLPAFAVLALPALMRLRRLPVVLFTACWVLPTWLVFELTATKLPHYTLPVLPGIAILAAVLLGRSEETPPARVWRLIAAGLLIVPIVGVAAANVVAAPVLGVWPSPPAAVIAALALVPGIAAMRAMAQGAAARALPSTLAAGLLLIVATWGFTMPALSPIWVSPRLAEAVERFAPCADPQVANVGFNEPSYIFLQGTDTWPTGPQQAAEFLAGADGACRVAVVDHRFEAAFLEALEAAGGGQAKSEVRVTGLNINGGDEMDIGLYATREAGRE